MTHRPDDASEPSALRRRLDQLPPSVWEPSPRPWSLRFIGYIAVAMGYVGFVAKGAILFHNNSSVEWLRENINPSFNRPELSPFEYTWSMVQPGVGMVVSLALLAGGIGVLKMRRWGRHLLIAYAIAAILLTLVSAGIVFASLDRQVALIVQASTQPFEGSISELKNRIALYRFIQTPALLIWPLTLLVLLNRPRLRDLLR